MPQKRQALRWIARIVDGHFIRFAGQGLRARADALSRGIRGIGAENVFGRRRCTTYWFLDAPRKNYPDGEATKPRAGHDVPKHGLRFLVNYQVTHGPIRLKHCLQVEKAGRSGATPWWPGGRGKIRHVTNFHAAKSLVPWTEHRTRMIARVELHNELEAGKEEVA